jgi:SNF2 family DNA or RNA helicase
MVVMDVPWNPVHNAQAIARIYRIGQTRPTFVYRLLMKVIFLACACSGVK